MPTIAAQSLNKSSAGASAAPSVSAPAGGTAGSDWLYAILCIDSNSGLGVAAPAVTVAPAGFTEEAEIEQTNPGNVANRLLLYSKLLAASDPGSSLLWALSGSTHWIAAVLRVSGVNGGLVFATATQVFSAVNNPAVLPDATAAVDRNLVLRILCEDDHGLLNGDIGKSGLPDGGTAIVYSRRTPSDSPGSTELSFALGYQQKDSGPTGLVNWWNEYHAAGCMLTVIIPPGPIEMANIFDDMTAAIEAQRGANAWASSFGAMTTSFTAITAANAMALAFGAMTGAIAGTQSFAEITYPRRPVLG